MISTEISLHRPRQQFFFLFCLLVAFFFLHLTIAMTRLEFLSGDFAALFHGWKTSSFAANSRRGLSFLSSNERF